jgi:hypothetical protein
MLYESHLRGSPHRRFKISKKRLEFLLNSYEFLSLPAFLAKTSFEFKSILEILKPLCSLSLDKEFKNSFIHYITYIHTYVRRVHVYARARR